MVRGLVPKYRRFNVWDDIGHRLPNTADWTLTARPLPRPPEGELSNVLNATTIRNNPSLFCVSTPINVDRFEELLVSHPNRAFVDSVLVGLREGFWPCADTTKDGYPVINDAHIETTKSPAEASFLKDHIEKEVECGRFSSAFGPDLLPGMYSMPIHAVPKDNGNTFRMVIDHSAGLYSLNSMIGKDTVSPSPLDNMRHLGQHLLQARRDYPNERFVMWKSDVSDAYRLLPMHPHWQLKQIITFNGRRYVDRRNTIGSRAGGALWIAFMSLVTWIAIHVRHIERLTGAYVDDSWGWEIENVLGFYTEYSEFMPETQTLVLELWDYLGIPHKQKKQIFGSPLTIIGFDVDPNAMSITMPLNAKNLLITELESWVTKPRSKHDGARTLKAWQTLAGWLNWALNVFPLLRPALNRVYTKISGVNWPLAKIWVNNDIRLDLDWALRHLRDLSGTRMIKSTAWDPASADVTIFADACLQGMGFWYPDHSVGYYSPTPPVPVLPHIYYFETLCVVSAITHAAEHLPNGKRLVVYTDNTNCVDIFSSLRCEPCLNPLLLHVADILLHTDIDLRVLHVPGEDNVVADAISRMNIATVVKLVPSFRLNCFQPPHITLGAPKK